MERSLQPSLSPAEIVNSFPLCTHIYPKGRQCRPSVAHAGDLFCALHIRAHLASPPADPLAELASHIGDAAEMDQASDFIAKIIKLACQNRISFARATALTYMANSLLNAMRLANYEARLLAAENPEELKINWEGIPRPDRENNMYQPISDSTGLPVPS
jgi:hypothetical protein